VQRKIDGRPGHGGAHGLAFDAERVDHPGVVELGQGGVVGSDFAIAAARGRQIGGEKRVFEQVERVGAADHKLPAPMNPVDDCALLLGRE
jgi:hypothetical protein